MDIYINYIIVDFRILKILLQNKNLFYKTRTR